MDNHLPIILIEVVVTFGGVLAFGWWQLRSIKKDQQKAAAQKLLTADPPDGTGSSAPKSAPRE